jgi:hypothetical protein
MILDLDASRLADLLTEELAVGGSESVRPALERFAESHGISI